MRQQLGNGRGEIQENEMWEKIKKRKVTGKNEEKKKKDKKVKEEEPERDTMNAMKKKV